MRLRVLDSAGPPELADDVAAGGFVSDMRRILTHAPELIGMPLSALLQHVLRDSPTEWSVGERELIAAFVAAENQCPF